MSETRKTPAESAELTELEELEELPELPDSPGPPDSSGEGGEAEPTARRRRGAAGGLEPGQLRELEQAPLHLRRAALVVAVFSLIPWNGQGAALGLSLAAKAVVLAGVYVWWAAHALEAGEDRKVPGFLGALGKANPKVLWGVAGVIAVVGLGPWIDGGNGFRGAAEKGMMAWAAATWVHIYGYERGGKFNPLFPLMFVAPAVGGVMGAIGHFRSSDWLSLVGAAGVAAGGFLAVYTIYEAMKQAKAHGDAKRKEALAARRRGRQGRAR